MTRLEVLQKAKRLLSDKDKWIQGLNAVTKTGRHTSVHSINACQFCFLGAMMHVYGRGYMDRDLFTSEEEKKIICTNDLEGYDAVMNLADRMIAAELKNNGTDSSPSEDNR